MSSHENSTADARRRVFIITPGRTGSSLLGAILNDAGADFGVGSTGDWDPAGGAFEHPDLVPIVHDFERMNALGYRRPHRLWPRLLWTLARHRAKRGLKAILPQAAYFKGELGPLVHWAARFGHPPTVIVSYRRFGDVLQSVGHLHPQPPSFHASLYDGMLRDALGLAAIYGGAVIDFEEIIDPSETAWAMALAEATGLDSQKLLDARAARIRPDATAREPAPEPFPSAAETYALLASYRGVCLRPASATRRAFNKS